MTSATPAADRDAWLTLEDLAWRPAVSPTTLSWRALKRLWRRQCEPSCVKEVMPPQTVGDRLSRHLWWDEYHHWMTACFAMLGWIGKPRSVSFCEWVDRSGLFYWGLPMWRVEIWYQMIAWEYQQWMDRIRSKAEYSTAKTINTLLRMLPVCPEESDMGLREEASILWRFLLLRRRRPKRLEEFFKVLTGTNVWGSLAEDVEETIWNMRFGGRWRRL